MPHPNQPLSPDLYEDFFRRQSWPEKWNSSEFSPEKWRMKVYDRVRSKPERSQSLVEIFLGYTMRSISYWLWGFFIYRTAYGSDEDWNQALTKLYRHIYYSIRYNATISEGDPEQINDELEAADIVAEGCYNVIIEDREILEGASPARVRQLFNEWLKRNPEHNHYGTPRSSICLMIDDHAIQSILASSEPGQDLDQPGYTIFVHREFPDRGGIRYEPYNVGWMRLTMDGIWQLWCTVREYVGIELEEIYPAIGRPGLIPYYDGFSPWVEDVDGQKVDNANEGEVKDREYEADEEGNYPLYDIYEYLKEGGHI